MIKKLNVVVGNKKPYQMPKLQVYGDIRTITQSNTVTGNADAGNKGKVHKTV
jgi:hypothetical protein